MVLAGQTHKKAQSFQGACAKCQMSNNAVSECSRQHSSAHSLVIVTAPPLCHSSSVCVHCFLICRTDLIAQPI